MDVGLDRAERLAGHLGDLLVRQALAEAQEQHLPVVGTQGAQPAVESPGEVVAVDARLGRLGALVGEHRREAPLVLAAAFERYRVERRPAQVVEGRVVGDLEQPAREAAGRVEGVEPAKGLQEDLLSDVLGRRGIAHHAHDQAEDRALVAHDEVVERPLRAGERGRRELDVARDLRRPAALDSSFHGVGYGLPPPELRREEPPPGGALAPGATRFPVSTPRRCRLSAPAHARGSPSQEPSRRTTMRKLLVWMFALCLTLPALPALAATLAGVTVPDHADAGGTALVLNGAGLRTKFFIKVYVGA